MDYGLPDLGCCHCSYSVIPSLFLIIFFLFLQDLTDRISAVLSDERGKTKSYSILNHVKLFLSHIFYSVCIHMSKRPSGVYIYVFPPFFVYLFTWVMNLAFDCHVEQFQECGPRKMLLGRKKLLNQLMTFTGLHIFRLILPENLCLCTSLLLMYLSIFHKMTKCPTVILLLFLLPFHVNLFPSI